MPQNAEFVTHGPALHDLAVGEATFASLSHDDAWIAGNHMARLVRLEEQISTLK